MAHKRIVGSFDSSGRGGGIRAASPPRTTAGPNLALLTGRSSRRPAGKSAKISRVVKLDGFALELP
jgi:hypothetical protein